MKNRPAKPVTLAGPTTMPLLLQTSAYTIIFYSYIRVVDMYMFLLIFALVILLVVGSATAMRYFDKPPADKKKNTDDPQT